MLTNGFHQSKPNTSTARLGETAPVVSVFPNPVQDRLTVSSHPDRSYRITITHVSGKPVKSLAATGSVEVDVSELASGVYTVSVTDQLTSKSFQIVKIK
ncbi:MAG TPA: T9SS type A sorting domain-containing protein [Cytophagales bacterium]